jgi:hypothetical protein
MLWRLEGECGCSWFSTRHAALYVRVSTSDRGQSVENQLQPLQEAAGRLGWTAVAVCGSPDDNGYIATAPRGGQMTTLTGYSVRGGWRSPQISKLPFSRFLIVIPELLELNRVLLLKTLS